MMGESKFVMGTRFGKRHGWELQRVDRGWRLTGRSWCQPATSAERVLWRRCVEFSPAEFSPISSKTEGKP